MRALPDLAYLLRNGLWRDHGRLGDAVMASDGAQLGLGKYAFESPPTIGTADW